jgi:hypothetical protein
VPDNSTHTVSISLTGGGSILFRHLPSLEAERLREAFENYLLNGFPRKIALTSIDSVRGTTRRVLVRVEAIEAIDQYGNSL